MTTLAARVCRLNGSCIVGILGILGILGTLVASPRRGFFCFRHALGVSIWACKGALPTYLQPVLTRNPFIPPMLATAVKAPPNGKEWIHECKMDGFRCQVHVRHGHATLYSRNGNDFTRRFRRLRPVLSEIPARAAIIDAELIACDLNGRPDFGALLRGDCGPLALWCFDLLSLDGEPLMSSPLRARKEILAGVVAAADHECLQFSGGFSDGSQIMAACERLGHEGIVSKRIDSRYTSGPSRDWVKSKTAIWRSANRNRFKLLKAKEWTANS